MHPFLPLGHLSRLGLDFRLHPGVGLLGSICQRLRHLPPVLPLLGAGIRPSCGLCFLPGRRYSLRLRLGGLRRSFRISPGLHLGHPFGLSLGLFRGGNDLLLDPCVGLPPSICKRLRQLQPVLPRPGIQLLPRLGLHRRRGLRYSLRLRSTLRLALGPGEPRGGRLARGLRLPPRNEPGGHGLYLPSRQRHGARLVRGALVLGGRLAWGFSMCFPPRTLLGLDLLERILELGSTLNCFPELQRARELPLARGAVAEGRLRLVVEHRGALDAVEEHGRGDQFLPGERLVHGTRRRACALIALHRLLHRRKVRDQVDAVGSIRVQGPGDDLKARRVPHEHKRHDAQHIGPHEGGGTSHITKHSSDKKSKYV